MNNSTTFEWRGTTFTVKRSTGLSYRTVHHQPQDGLIIYRDVAHVGGPWSDAHKSAVCTSLHPMFRRRLRTAMGQI